LTVAEVDVAGFGVKIGPKINTGVHVGVDGAGVEVLRFGVSIGPETSIKTPIGANSCCIM